MKTKTAILKIIKKIFILSLIAYLFSNYSFNDKPDSIISDQSYSVLKIMNEANLYQLSSDETLGLYTLNLELSGDFKDESNDFKEWLIITPPDNTLKFDYSTRDDKFYNFTYGDNNFVLWFYSGLIGEPPVIQFNSGYSPTVIAGSMEEFVCRLIQDADRELELDEYDIPNLDIKSKLYLNQYAVFKSRINSKVDCPALRNHKKQMLRHPILSSPLTFEIVDISLKGEDIVKLIGLSLKDDKILNTLSSLDYEVPLYDSSDQSFYSEGNKGVTFSFQPSDTNNGLNLNSIEFDDSYILPPFGIQETDNLDIVEKKIGRKANYVSINDEFGEGEIPSYTLYWNYKDLGSLTIQFDKNDYSGVWSISTRLYENYDNDEGWRKLIAPFKR